MIVSSIDFLTTLSCFLAAPSYFSLTTSSPGATYYRHCARASLNGKRPSARVDPRRRERASYGSTNCPSCHILFPPYSFPFIFTGLRRFIGIQNVPNGYRRLHQRTSLHLSSCLCLSSIVRTTFYLRVRKQIALSHLYID